MYQNKFTLLPANGFVWNQKELLDFLVANQRKKISICTRGEGLCLESAGVYQILQALGYDDVTIITNNALEQHPYFEIHIERPQMFFEIFYTNYQQYHHWNKNKVFGCLYNRALWHRIGLAAEMQVTHNDISLINFRSDPQDPDQRQLFEIQQLFEQAPQSLEKFCQVKDQWPVQIESIDCYTAHNDTNGHTDQLADFYPEFLIDLVAETWIQGRCFFPTEKTIRPMLLKKPMIVMGSRNYLTYLRQMGFQTFNEFWDEDYDGYADGNRYAKILDLIKQLCSVPVEQLHDMYQRMQPILDHNYNLLTSGNYKKEISYIE